VTKGKEINEVLKFYGENLTSRSSIILNTGGHGGKYGENPHTNPKKYAE
jgi:hypothetical protein